MSIALSAHPSAAWPLAVGGHAIRIRALTSAEMLEAQEAAARSAPPDLYGQTIYARLHLDHAQRMMDLRGISLEAAKLANAAAAEGAAGEAMRALELSDKALKNLTRECSEGLGRMEALLREEDPTAAAALDRFTLHLTAPHRQLAARALVEWPGRLAPGFSVADALAALGPNAADPMGLDGLMVAEAVVQSLTGRALGERGKGRFAPPSSSAGATTKGNRRTQKARGTAKRAKR